MREILSAAQMIFSFIGAGIGMFLGDVDGLVIALLVFVVMDYITGVMCAIVDQKLSSEIGFKGIFKKVVIFMLVGVANILDTQIIKTGSVIRTAVIFFYLSNEGISLLENAAHLNLPIPKKLIKILDQLKEESENKGE